MIDDWMVQLVKAVQRFDLDLIGVEQMRKVQSRYRLFSNLIFESEEYRSAGKFETIFGDGSQVSTFIDGRSMQNLPNRVINVDLRCRQSVLNVGDHNAYPLGIRGRILCKVNQKDFIFLTDRRK